MRYRKLGRTPLEISEIGLGCSGFWGNRLFPEEKAAEIIVQAFDAGVNFFDTGHNYCNYNAEPRLGRTLKQILKHHDRSRLVISSKAGTVIPSAPLLRRKHQEIKNFSPDYIEETCRKSIANLNCEYLDIFQLHGVSAFHITEPLVERLLTMKEKGLFRCLGINTHSIGEMVFVCEHPEIFDVILIDYNVLQLDRDEIIHDLHRAGIGVIAGTVLAQGHLVNRNSGKIRSLADIWYLARTLLKPSSRCLQRNAKEMQKALMTSNVMSGAQAAFAYILENKQISSCVFGTTSRKNLLEILETPNLLLDERCRSAVRESFEALPEKISL